MLYMYTFSFLKEQFCRVEHDAFGDGVLRCTCY